MARFERHLSALAMTALILVAAGCATTVASEDSPTPTAPVATPSPAPTTSAEATPTASDPAADEFTVAQLAEICIDVTRSTYAGDVVFDAAGARIEERTVEPHWLVIVPASTAGYQGESRCTIGGTADEPVIGMSEGSIERRSEAEIQDIIHGRNEGGDD